MTHSDGLPVHATHFADSDQGYLLKDVGGLCLGLQLFDCLSDFSFVSD